MTKNLSPMIPERNKQRPSVVYVSSEDGKLITAINERRWQFPHLLETIESQGYFLLQDFPLNFLIKDKKIIAVVLPTHLVQQNPT